MWLLGSLPYAPGADPAELAEKHLPLDAFWDAL
jgi:hypothetical protein